MGIRTGGSTGKASRVSLVRIEDLVSHEDVDRARLRKILSSIAEERVLRKPVVVDARRGIVIDGHHRVQALKLLGVRYAPAVLADYELDVEDVGRWMYIGAPGDSKRLTLLKTLSEAILSAKQGNSTVNVIAGGDAESFKVDGVDLYLAFRELGVYTLLSWLVKTPYDSGLCVSSGLCVEMPKLSIYDIYIVAQRGVLLPPRTTYHRTPLKHITAIFKLDGPGVV